MGRSISIVTPTLNRPSDVRALFANLATQTIPPFELILVDAAAPDDNRTQNVVDELASGLPFPVRYHRFGGGTAIQRNYGIERAQGDFIAFIDDDVRLEPDFFERILEVYSQDIAGEVGGVAGYITNQYFDPSTSRRWIWYRRLRIFTTFEPGRYDFGSGYPVNRYMHPPHDGVREIDFMGSNCCVWRRQVCDQGHRFDEFFRNYGVLEDAHFAVHAGLRGWKILECGRARCIHLHSPGGREKQALVAWKTAVNYRYVFLSVVPRPTWRQNLRFWTVQVLQLLGHVDAAIRRPKEAGWATVAAKFRGILHAARLRPAVPRSA